MLLRTRGAKEMGERAMTQGSEQPGNMAAAYGSGHSGARHGTAVAGLRNRCRCLNLRRATGNAMCPGIHYSNSKVGISVLYMATVHVASVVRRLLPTLTNTDEVPEVTQCTMVQQ